MKLSASGLKNLNWKQFLVDHGEKLVLGGVVLVGLFALASSRWAPYSEKSPYGLIKAVEDAKKVHQTSTLPEPKLQELASTEDVYAKAQQLLSPLDETRYAFSRTLPEIYWPIIPQKQQIQEPKWFAVEALEASFGRVLYAKAPSLDDALASAETTEEAAETETEPSSSRTGPRGFDIGDFRPSSRPTGATGFPGSDPSAGHGDGGYTPPEAAAENGPRPRGRSRGRGRGAEGPGGGHGGGSSGGHGGGGSSTGPGGGHGGGGSSGGHGGGGAMPYPGMGGGYGMAGPVEAEARRFVSVRGVFPVKKQERELASALGLQSAAQAVDALQFQDFELERQRAVQGPDPWAGPWEKVDLQVAQDVLNEQANFAADVVEPSVTNPVFTMPLPGRLIGEWKDKDASHPFLSQFELTEDAKKQQLWLQEKIAEYAAWLEEEKKNAPPQQGGFASQQYDARQIGGMMLADEGYMSQMMGSRGALGGRQAAGQAGQGEPKLTKDDIKSMITASGTYLLFRFLDFDVEPGNAYRYRVRLQVHNPAYGRDPGEAVRADIVEEPFRWTEWSEPTEPVIVPKDTRHFLVAVDNPGPNQPEQATFAVFQWTKEFGTFVDEFLDVEPGQFIGGEAKTDVIDPAGQTFEEKDFTFTSSDVLVDIDRNGVNLASRPDLSLSDRKFQVPSQVLIVNDWGGLEVQDPVSTADNRRAWEEAMGVMKEAYAHLREQAAPTTGETGLEYEDPYGGMMSARGGRGAANPLRRGGRGGAGMGPSNPYGGGGFMPSGGFPPSGGGPPGPRGRR